MKGRYVCVVLVALASAAPAASARQRPSVGHLWDFDGNQRGTAPSGWSFHQTKPSGTKDKAKDQGAGKDTTRDKAKAPTTWRVLADPTAPSDPNALTLFEPNNDDRTFNLALVEDSSFKDIDLSVQVKPMGGKVDQGGGAIWRARDENNYYVSRFNPLESNFRVYYVKNGRRHQLKSAEVNTVVGVWQLLRVTMIGKQITCYLDGKKLLEVSDDTFQNPGMVGLWTKADAVTRFDSLLVFPQQPPKPPPLTQRQDIALPGVKGPLEQLALDAKGNRLFLTAPEHGTVEVIDLATGKTSRTLKGLSTPQGIFYMPKSKRVIVACGDGSVRSFNSDTLKEVARCELGTNANSIRWDAKRNLLYVGFGDGAVGVLNADDLTKQHEIKVGGHPGALRFHASKGRIYVNVPGADQIAVIDAKTRSVVGRWKTAGTSENHAMALEKAGETLLVACRTPPRLVAFDTFLGARLATVPCAGDANAVLVDDKGKRIYVVGGEGFVDIFVASVGGKRSSRYAYPRLARVPTAPGARSAAFDREQGLLYVAAPAHEGQEARVLVFQVPR